jgi:hypothetical protein
LTINKPVDKDNPVVIYEDLYNYTAEKAKEKGLTIKEYANSLITMSLKRYAYLEREFPKLKLAMYEEHGSL